MFGFGKQDAFRKFEGMFKKVFRQQVSNRDADNRNAFVTPDILRRRNELTKSGRQKLVLDYGARGKKEYSLADLNQMAKAALSAEKRFGTDSRGVPVAALIKACSQIDITRAQTQIATSTLYKIHGNDLSFRVSASKESKYSYHQVRIRLDSWDSEMRGLHGGGGDYLQSAKRAVAGRVSFNCDCGRHRYWYRYLATIGGFGLDPLEKVFPKIRNPKLTGCCCKHVIKTLATLRMHPVQLKVAQEMEDQGKKKGFFSKLFHGSAPQEKYVADTSTEQAGKDSDVATIQKEYNTYRQAKKGFDKKMAGQKKQKTQTVSQLQKDNFIKSLQIAMLTAQVNGQPRSEAIKEFASAHNTTEAAIETIAKSHNL